jgi:hypothetical protein
VEILFLARKHGEDGTVKILRVPPDINAWLEREADKTAGTQKSEIIRAIRHQMAEQERVALLANKLAAKIEAI